MSERYLKGGLVRVNRCQCVIEESSQIQVLDGIGNCVMKMVQKRREKK